MFLSKFLCRTWRAADGRTTSTYDDIWRTYRKVTDAAQMSVLGLVPNVRLLCRSGRERQRPHLQRHFVVLARKPLTRTGAICHVLPDGEFARRQTRVATLSSTMAARGRRRTALTLGTQLPSPARQG